MLTEAHGEFPGSACRQRGHVDTLGGPEVVEISGQEICFGVEGCHQQLSSSQVTTLGQTLASFHTLHVLTEEGDSCPLSFLQSELRDLPSV